MTTRYAIERYRKGEDRPDGETDVTAVDSRSLAELFGCSLDQFADVYAVEPKHAEALATLTGLGFDLSGYDYFLSITAD
ncbi:hypothetical protein ACFW9O_13825 [Streptomyces sp. NPDC059499]|uniref:DUF7683 domain-containing protein n=1 Tax=Streptomyces sp. NPDC059499 TaxID=3346852 RepID=UPI00369F3A0C